MTLSILIRIKKQFEVINDNNLFVVDFIRFQYGTLSENCKPHKNVIERLKNDLRSPYYTTLKLGLAIKAFEPCKQNSK